MSKNINDMTKMEKLKQLSDLHYSKGYAEALMQYLKMVVHLKGEDNNTTITLGELSELAQIALESLPAFQEFKKDKGLT